MTIPTPFKAAEEIFKAAVRAADPYRAVEKQKDLILSKYRNGGFGRLIVIGFGKASAAMAAAIEDTLGDFVETGIVVTKYGHLGNYKLTKIKAFEAAHPVPDEYGQKAAAEILGLLTDSGDDTLVVCLISGGGSALLASPAEGVSLSDKQTVTSALLKAGADITELNAVRKHISLVKGGRLANAAYPATMVSLIISDVIGDSLDVIASGPTSPDSSTWQAAFDVMDKYGINQPENVIKLIKKGADGSVPDTPKSGDPIFDKVEHFIIGSNRLALAAAKKEAESLGFNTEILTDALRGEARDASRVLASDRLLKGPPPLCLIAGGETTVTVRGSGKGGRNTELALAFSLEIEDKDGITLLAAGTDGTDGPTDAAGAFANGETARNARKSGIDPSKYLANNDSYTFFELAGGLFKTGPTGTNVMDIDIILLT